MKKTKPSPVRRFDLLSEMVRIASRKVERSVPLLKLEDLVRDKPSTNVSMH